MLEYSNAKKKTEVIGEDSGEETTARRWVQPRTTRYLCTFACIIPVPTYRFVAELLAGGYIRIPRMPINLRKLAAVCHGHMKYHTLCKRGFTILLVLAEYMYAAMILAGG